MTQEALHPLPPDVLTEPPVLTVPALADGYAQSDPPTDPPTKPPGG